MNECMRQAQDPGERASQAWGATPLSPVSSSQGLFWDAPSPSPWLPHPSSQLEEAPPESPESPHRGTDHCTANASSRVAYNGGPRRARASRVPALSPAPGTGARAGETLSKHAPRRKPPNSCVVPQVPPCLLGKPEGASFGGHTTSRVVGALKREPSGSWELEGPALHAESSTERWACAVSLGRKTGTRQVRRGKDGVSRGRQV